jgi:hypothetical protein
MDHSVQSVVNRIIDAAAAISLIAALAVIYSLDRQTADELPAVANNVKLSTVTKTQPPRPLTIAVTPAQFDDMGKLLDTMGSGYGTYDTIQLDDLSDIGRLKRHDVIFLTCRNEPRLSPRSRLSLREFVAAGGTLYASDLWFNMIAETFLEFAPENRLPTGKKQKLTAEIVDPGLQAALGSSLDLNFEVDDWCPAGFAGPNVTAIMKGRYTPMKGDRQDVPLLVRFPYHKGTVIFTSFHNARQNDQAELKLLRHLVFIAATAQEEAKVTETIASGGFSPKKQNLLTASSNNPSVTQSYTCTKSGRLKFALAFGNRGARLRLTIFRPDGSKEEKEGTETFYYEVDNAAVGDWKYTITALELPYPDFPFQLTIAQ